MLESLKETKDFDAMITQKKPNNNIAPNTNTRCQTRPKILQQSAKTAPSKNHKTGTEMQILFNTSLGKACRERGKVNHFKAVPKSPEVQGRPNQSTRSKSAHEVD